jgi:protein-disulfide isomerase
VKIVFRHQPLPFHNNAMPAAKASMAAHKQGKFWEMHDKMFANQQALSPEKYEEWAKELKLDLAKFKSAMDSSEIADQIKKDSDEGNAVGANGTPTFFINGRELSGAQPFESFKAIIDEEIKKADELLKSGVKLEQVYDKLTSSPPSAAVPTAQAAPPTVKIGVGDSPVKGNKNAKVKVYEFSDFQ